MVEGFDRLRRDCHELTSNRSEKILLVLGKNIEAALSEKAEIAVRLLRLKASLNEDHSIYTARQEAAALKEAIARKGQKEDKISFKTTKEDGGKQEGERIVGLKKLRWYTSTRDNTEIISSHSDEPKTSAMALNKGFKRNRIRDLAKAMTPNIHKQQWIDFSKEHAIANNEKGDECEDCKGTCNVGGEIPDETDNRQHAVQTPSTTPKFCNRFSETMSFEEHLCSFRSDFINDTVEIQINESHLGIKNFQNKII